MKFALNLFAVLLYTLFSMADAHAQCTANAGRDTAMCLSNLNNFQLGGTPVVTGGIAPYTYSWSCRPYYFSSSITIHAGEMLDDTTLANPELIDPPTDDTIRFYLQVEDSLGNTCVDSVNIKICQVIANMQWKYTFLDEGDSFRINSFGVGACSGVASYRWTPNYNISDTSISNPVVWPYKTTHYSVFMVDSIGCEFGTSWDVFVNKLGIIERVESTSLSIFPNPIIEQATIKLSEIPAERSVFLMYDTKGRLVREIPLTKSNTAMDREGLESGVYFYHLIQGNSRKDQGKVVIK